MAEEKQTAKFLREINFRWNFHPSPQLLMDPWYCMHNSALAGVTQLPSRYCMHNSALAGVTHLPSRYCMHNSALADVTQLPSRYCMHTSALAGVTQLPSRYCMHNSALASVTQLPSRYCMYNSALAGVIHICFVSGSVICFNYGESYLSTRWIKGIVNYWKPFIGALINETQNIFHCPENIVVIYFFVHVRRSLLLKCINFSSDRTMIGGIFFLKCQEIRQRFYIVLIRNMYSNTYYVPSAEQLSRAAFGMPAKGIN